VQIFQDKWLLESFPHAYLSPFVDSVSWWAPHNLYAYHVGSVDIDIYLHSLKGHMQNADRG
jgi:hypothetical protein